MQSKEITADSQVARIFEWRRGFNTIHLIDVGIRAGLFKALTESPGLDRARDRATSSACMLRLSKPGARPPTGWNCWMRTMAPRYRLAPFFDSILAAPDPSALSGRLRAAGYGSRRGGLPALRDRRLRTGEVKPFQGRGDDFAQAIAESTWGLQVVTAKKILPALDGLAARLEAGGTVLEVGCGTGNLLVQLAKAFPQARCVGVDIDADSLASGAQPDREGRDRGARAGAPGNRRGRRSRRASVDAVVMVEVLHEIAPSIRPSVINESAAALKPGGWMVIVDETYPSTLEEMRKPEFRFPLMTGFEEMVWGNVLPTREEQEKLLRDAGLTGPIDRT